MCTGIFCMYFTGPYGYLAPPETREWWLVLWDWNYRQFSADIWVLGWNTHTQEEQPVS